MTSSFLFLILHTKAAFLSLVALPRLDLRRPSWDFDYDCEIDGSASWEGKEEKKRNSGKRLKRLMTTFCPTDHAETPRRKNNTSRSKPAGFLKARSMGKEEDDEKTETR